MNFNIEQIKELRARTHLGMADCKKALEEAFGDLEQAIEILKKKGLKKIDDSVIPLEGQVRASVTCNDYSNFGFICEVNVQTDFGSKSEIFESFISEYMADPNISLDVRQERCNMLSKQLGEKVVVRKSKLFLNKDKDYQIYTYNHPGGRVAVLLELKCCSEHWSSSKFSKLLLLQQFAENITMHVAAMKPLAVSRDQLVPEVIAKQKEFFLQQLAEDPKPKPAAALPKIIEGKMNKWYSEVVLLDQESVVEPGNTIQKLLDKVSKELGEKVIITRFVRFELGCS